VLRKPKIRGEAIEFIKSSHIMSPT
jgi:hypothetical protein